MDRPTKKDTYKIKGLEWFRKWMLTSNIVRIGYNQACDDWEKYCDSLVIKELESWSLPSEEEIADIIDSYAILGINNDVDLSVLIHKRIRGER